MAAIIAFANDLNGVIRGVETLIARNDLINTFQRDVDIKNSPAAAAAEVIMAVQIAIVAHETVIIDALDQVSISELVQVAVNGSQADVGNGLPHLLEDPLGGGVPLRALEYFENCVSLLAVTHDKQ